MAVYRRGRERLGESKASIAMRGPFNEKTENVKGGAN